MTITEKQALVSSILAGLKTNAHTTAEAVTGGKHDANTCGTQSGCLIWPG